MAAAQNTFWSERGIRGSDSDGGDNRGGDGCSSQRILGVGFAVAAIMYHKQPIAPGTFSLLPRAYFLRLQ